MEDADARSGSSLAVDFPTPPNVPPSTQLVRYLPYAGVVLVTVAVFSLALMWRVRPELALAVLAGVGTMLYAGKEVGIPVGLAAGADAVTMGIFILLVDVAFTCFAYPPLHYAIRSWLYRPGPIGAYLRHVRKGADRHKGFVLRHRKWGLFLFMLVPFAINGPLVGAILGRLIGMRARQIVPTLILAIAATTIAWSTIYGLGFAYAERMNPLFPKLLTGGLIALVLLGGVFSLLRARRAHAEEVRRPDAPLTP